MAGDFTGGREILHGDQHLEVYRAVAAVLLAFLTTFPDQLGSCAFDSYPEARRPENG